ncbi:MAG: type II toxin-antitoxin system RelE/ParE family toxin [Gammaproteobacteria bacterium]|nr:type II toxin-antitoxin system RelE/ParE family toxin [Gammaproteobacteria bacterium]MCP4402578.1 type II toxin-antitoxin system RelE/ParE family toxin [bacterium]
MRKIASHTLEHWGEPQRDAYISELFEAFSHLADTPEIAAKIDNIRNSYRKFPLGSHIIYFRHSDTHAVEIIRVLHKRIDAPDHLTSP